jgi:hypothetical protein
MVVWVGCIGKRYYYLKSAVLALFGEVERWAIGTEMMNWKIPRAEDWDNFDHDLYETEGLPCKSEWRLGMAAATADTSGNVALETDPDIAFHRMRTLEFVVPLVRIVVSGYKPVGFHLLPVEYV